MKKTMSNILITLPTLIFLVLFSTSSACHSEDLKALLSIKNSFPPNSFPPSWNASTDCCHWDYILCDPNTGRLDVLQITDNENIRGPIPPSLGRLSTLTFMILRDLPNLVGPIPHQLSKLKNLLFFIISNTSVSGPIPDFLSEFPDTLSGINLNGNRLSGPIPASLGNLTGVSPLFLNGNRLSGPIPDTLFSKLDKNISIQLDLSDNELSGEIPKSFGNIPFTDINLANNQLTGDASLLFGKSKQAANNIMLANNRLAFDLTNVEYPDQLKYLDISHNEIYGKISHQITHVKDLESFDVSYNRLCGEIPISLGKFNSSFFANNQCLCGAPLPPCK